VERLKRHYEMFRESIEKKAGLTDRLEANRIQNRRGACATSSAADSRLAKNTECRTLEIPQSRRRLIRDVKPDVVKIGFGAWGYTMRH